MTRSIRWLLLGALPIFLILLPTSRADACSVCLAGDPIFDAQGTTAQQQGDFTFYFQARG